MSRHHERTHAQRRMPQYALNNVRTWVQPEKSSPPLAVFPASCEVVRCVVMVLGCAPCTLWLICVSCSEPLGTVCIIGAWNVPFGLVFLPLIGAIAAGNAAVVKPSELASSSAKVACWSNRIPIVKFLLRCTCVQLIGDLIQRYLDKEAVVVVQGIVLLKQRHFPSAPDLFVVALY